MQSTIYKWLSKAVLATVMLLNTILPTYAASIGTQDRLAITNYSVSPNPVNFETEKYAEILYTISKEAEVTLKIYKRVDADSFALVGKFADSQLQSAGSYSFKWNGETGPGRELVAAGAGLYYYALTAVDTDSSARPKEAYVAEWITVVESDDSSNNNNDPQPDDPNNDYNDDNDDDNDSIDLEIENLEVLNGTFDPWDNQKAKIVFNLTKKAYVTLDIYEEDGDYVLTLLEDELLEEGEQVVKWDGEDVNDQIVAQGDYKFRLTAKYNDEKEVERGDLVVERDYYGDSYTSEHPKILEFYITKEEFEAGSESTYFVFDLSAKADIRLAIYNSEGGLIEEAYERSEQPAKTYRIEWDGGKLMGEEGKFIYELTVDNDSGSDQEKGVIELKFDERKNTGPNLYDVNVDADNLPFKPKNNTLAFDFRLNSASEVTLQIRDRKRVVAEVASSRYLNPGLNTILWDGKDDEGWYLEEGTYEYKIIARNNLGQDTEKGYISLEESSALSRGEKCANFSDISQYSQYCDAIEWSKGQGIFEGYPDGSFKPNQQINRVEALKVVFVALDINTLDGYGQNLGFYDVEAFAWYVDYIKTALSLGVVNGYSDGSYKPYQTVTVAEALKILLETAKVKHGLVIPFTVDNTNYRDVPQNAWYNKYAAIAQSYDLTNNEEYLYPNSGITRAQMADLLYRFDQAGLNQ